ncbi:flagellar hook-associated protein FlgK, partial [candidate division KSB1 bacterium]
NTQTIQEFYSELISDIGAQSWKVTYERENAETLVQSLENQRQSIMGVSLDEEMVNMIKYQNAFVAATRLIGTIDEMMKTVLQMI